MTSPEQVGAREIFISRARPAKWVWSKRLASRSPCSTGHAGSGGRRRLHFGRRQIMRRPLRPTGCSGDRRAKISESRESRAAQLASAAAACRPEAARKITVSLRHRDVSSHGAFAHFRPSRRAGRPDWLDWPD